MINVTNKCAVNSSLSGHSCVQRMIIKRKIVDIYECDSAYENRFLRVINIIFKGNEQFVQKVTFEPLTDFKQKDR